MDGQSGGRNHERYYGKDHGQNCGPSEARYDEAAGGLALNELRRGAAAYIAAVEARGELRRRLIELGYFPGERVEKVLTSPLGDPSAYLVRGTVTAIRSSDAAQIRVREKAFCAAGGAENEAENGAKSGVEKWD